MLLKTPIRNKIWLSSPHMGNTEQAYVKEAFDTNWVAPLGPNVDQFEKAIEDFIDNEVYVAALSSGTAAIHLALALLGVSKGDDVLCQSFTFSASANPILYLGANPIFIDSEKDTWNLSPELLKKAIEARIAIGKKPKAIIAVHLYGMPYKISDIKKISDYYTIPVIEDSAEAFGSSFEGVHCGGFGDIGILSFNGNKIITTSGGGALVTKKEEVKKRAIFLATQARDDAPHYQHSSLGYNYRMSNVLAGIGRGQMEVLEDRVKARRRIYQTYFDQLADLKTIEFLKEPTGGYYTNRWLTCILTPSFETREEIRNVLLAHTIESRPLWKPLHMQPVFKEYAYFSDGTSEDLFNRGLCLPSGSNLTIEEVHYIIALIKTVIA